MAKRKRRNSESVVWWVLSGIFMIMGGIFMTISVIYPCWMVVASQDWAEVPAEVKSSQVRSERNSKGHVSYHLKITYNYLYEKRWYTGDRYNFSSGNSSGGLAEKQRVVKEYPVGKAIHCFVDPGNPCSSVIKRELGWGIISASLLSSLFLVFGIGGLFMVRRSKKMRYGLEPPKELFRSHDGDYPLKARGGGFKEILNLWFLALLLLFPIVSLIVKINEKFGKIVFLPLLVLGLICAAGIFLLAVSMRKFFHFVSNHYEAYITEPVAHPGEKTTLKWRFPEVLRKKKMVILLSGWESLTIPQGNHRRTVRTLFYSQILLVQAPPEAGEGVLQFTIPPDMMHSVKLQGNSEYYWTVGLYAWNGSNNYVGSDFTLPVAPPRRERGA